MEVSRGSRAQLALAGLAVGAVILIAAGTYAIQGGSRSPDRSPDTTGAPSGAATMSPDPSASADAAATPGTASIEFSSGQLRDQATIAVTCKYPSPAHLVIVPTSIRVFGEPVTVGWESNTVAGGKLVLDRDGAARYTGELDLAQALESGVTAKLELDSNDDGPAAPLGEQKVVQPVTAWFYARCNWQAGAGPVTAPQDPSFMTLGTAKLAIGDSGATSADAQIECHWYSKASVAYQILGPIDLAGERVQVELLEYSPSGAGLAIVRDGLVAGYSGRRQSFDVQGWGTARGTMAFRQLTLDPDGYPYPRGVPLPTPIGWFLKPLAGLEANRTLSGSLTWDCGSPPVGAQATEAVGPTEPPSDHWRPFPWPTVSVQAGSHKAAAELVICASGYEPAAPDAYLPWGCEGDQYLWRVPEATLEARVGEATTWTVPGYEISSVELKYAARGEVERWRGGQPDSTVVLKPTSALHTSARFAALPAGDWVVIFTVMGTNSAGDKLTANYAVGIHVTE